MSFAIDDQKLDLLDINAGGDIEFELAGRIDLGVGFDPTQKVKDAIFFRSLM